MFSFIRSKYSSTHNNHKKYFFHQANILYRTISKSFDIVTKLPPTYMLSFLHYFPLLQSHLQIFNSNTPKYVFTGKIYGILWTRERRVLNFHLDFGILRQFQAHLFPESWCPQPYWKCKISPGETKLQERAICMAVFCLSPVSIQKFIPAFLRVSIVSGTPSWIVT